MADILLVDDHIGFRKAARALLEAAGYGVIGEAGDGSEAIRLTELLQPDVVLLDVNLPDSNGFEIAPVLREVRPQAVVVMISGRRPSALSRRVEVSGVAGFIHKEGLSAISLAELIED